MRLHQIGLHWSTLMTQETQIGEGMESSRTKRGLIHVADWNPCSALLVIKGDSQSSSNRVQGRGESLKQGAGNVKSWQKVVISGSIPLLSIRQTWQTTSLASFKWGQLREEAICFGNLIEYAHHFIQILRFNNVSEELWKGRSLLPENRLHWHGNEFLDHH